MNRHYLLPLIFFSLIGSPIFSQVTVDLGNGNFSNSDFGVDGPYSFLLRSSKTQTIISSSELTNEGLGSGFITGLGFFVDALSNGTALEDFSLRIAHSTGPIDNSFQGGLTEVFSTSVYTVVAGYNVHTFSTPFFWDGFSDLIVQTCYDNNNPGFPNENSVRFSVFGQNGFAESDHFGVAIACNDNQSEVEVNGRPDIRLIWESAELPPVANFSITSFAPCSGVIFLNDVSLNQPDTWLWYFGDGTTSTDPDPSHTYLADGTYTISLVSSNEFGSDSIAIEDAVTVTLTGILPTASTCIPSSANPALGFGISSVTLAGVSNASSAIISGYEDFTCTLFTLDQGLEYTLDVEVNGAAPSRVVAWIDYDGNGVFIPSEKIVDTDVAVSASLAFTPSNAALTDSTLRLRIVSDFFLIGSPGPCASLSGGQGEDYSIIISSNQEGPTASFTFSPSLSCDGTVSFFDESENVPENWLWLFGDGDFSTLPSPTHTYTNSGTYDVTLTVQNAFGSDDTLAVGAVTVDLSQALTPACQVNTTSYCCGYGIQNVNLNGQITTSANASEGYQDFSCEVELTVTEGESFSFSSFTGNDNPQDLSVFIDFNDDGGFGLSERVFLSQNATNHSGMIAIPFSVPVENTRLRLRVIADFVGNGNTGCTNTQFGQAEDYSIVIMPDLSLPEANFNASPLFSCDGEVDFNNLSSGNSTEFTWYFGDGITSNDEAPSHTYTSSGQFTVSLVAFNDNGQDSLAFLDYIEVDFEGVCDTTFMPTNGTAPVLTECNGFLTDDGGPDGNYSSNSNGIQAIETTVGNKITLDFITFFFQSNDFLRIYDGPDITAPLIGQYTGNSLPNGGSIESTGNSITLRQTTNFGGNVSGFILEWSCSPLGIEELIDDHLTIYPNPAQDYLMIALDDILLMTAQVYLSDLSGRSVTTPRSIRGGRMDLSDIADGNYILIIQTEDHLMTRKISIQR